MDSDTLRSVVKEYLRLEKVEEHKKTIQALIDNNNYGEIKRLFGDRLQFGTAGIRGRMGPGYNQMNDLVVIQTAQGLVSYLTEIDSQLIKEKGVIIGNDARHNSQRFARLVAVAFLQKGIKVYFNDYIVPTPFIAFGVKQYSCRAGIMVTASHNPKEDNGIKVYWHNGAQILSPHDSCIQEHILKPENREPWPRAWDHSLLQRSTLSSESQPSLPSSVTGPLPSPATNNESTMPEVWKQLLHRVYGDLGRKYFQYIETLIPSAEQRNRNKSDAMTITFTPMHGVGHIFMERALTIGGFEDIYPVENQKRPDPNFTTVKFPNPEESGALDEAFKTAKNSRSNLILANDPDSDRCAAAIYDPSNGYKRVLNGNEIGSLLGWWLWHSLLLARDVDKDCESSDQDKDKYKFSNPSNCYMISTAVSSKFLNSMAEVEGFNFIETLTGFKYMGNVADELINLRGAYVVFAYEEAIGFMVNTRIYDKDGISASLQLAQCAAYCSTAYHRNLEEQLDWLYHKYGYHYNMNSYFICNDPGIIKEIFTHLQANYPTQFEGGFKVKRVRDLNNNYDSGTPDKKAALPSTSSYMVTFFVDDDITLTIRTSGTEPKIKYYSEIVNKLSQTHHANEKEIAQRRLASLVNVAIKQCLKPDQYNLQPAL